MRKRTRGRMRLLVMHVEEDNDLQAVATDERDDTELKSKLHRRKNATNRNHVLLLSRSCCLNTAASRLEWFDIPPSGDCHASRRRAALSPYCTCGSTRSSICTCCRLSTHVDHGLASGYSAGYSDAKRDESQASCT